MDPILMEAIMNLGILILSISILNNHIPMKFQQTQFQKDKWITVESEGIAFLGSGMTETDAKIIALEDAKRNALEKAGTYLASLSFVKDFQLQQDEIVAFTGSFLKTEICQESRDIINNMFALKLKIKAKIDTEFLEDKLNHFEDHFELKDQIQEDMIRNQSIGLDLHKLKTDTTEISEDNVKALIYSLSAEEWFNKGLNTKDNKEKVNFFTKSIRLDPTYLKAFYYRGLTYYSLERYQDAIKDFTEILRQNPEHVRAFNQRGKNFDKIGSNVQAVDDFTKAIQYQPDYTIAYYNRWLIYQKTGEETSAQSDYQILADLGFWDSRKDPQNENKIEEINGPDWFKSVPTSPDFYYASGHAVSDQAAVALTKAAENARNELTETIMSYWENTLRSFNHNINFEDKDIQNLLKNLSREATKTFVKLKAGQYETMQKGDRYHAFVLFEFPVHEIKRLLVNEIKKVKSFYKRIQSSEVFQKIVDELKRYKKMK
jgi:tetratricopeptide (TPR) repeat protein